MAGQHSDDETPDAPSVEAAPADESAAEVPSVEAAPADESAAEVPSVEAAPADEPATASAAVDEPEVGADPEAAGDEPAQGTLPSVDTAPQGEPRRPPAPPEEEEEDDAHAYKVKLDVFEGPLDLLLHLIRKHELDVLDIPISFITKKYLEYLEVMQGLAIDVASEYLVMAATLAWIKSKTLLPPEPGSDDEEEEEEDPRADLVRRLLEYQKYKHVAAQLRARATLGKEMFERGTSEPVPEGPSPLAPVSVFKLFDAFDRVLKRADQQADHKVLFERVTITERIVELTELLNQRRQVKFEELFFTDAEGREQSSPARIELVVTFLALLEMCKMRLARIRQEEALGELMVEVRSKHLDDPDAESGLAGFSSEFDGTPAEAAPSPADQPDATPDGETAPADENTPGDPPGDEPPPPEPPEDEAGSLHDDDAASPEEPAQAEPDEHETES